MIYRVRRVGWVERSETQQWCVGGTSHLILPFKNKSPCWKNPAGALVFLVEVVGLIGFRSTGLIHQIKNRLERNPRLFGETDFTGAAGGVAHQVPGTPHLIIEDDQVQFQGLMMPP